MTNTLILITFLFLAIIIYLLNKIQADRLKYHSKIKVLEDFIVQLSDEQKLQNSQLQLSAELKQKLNDINSKLNKEIYELNLSLIEDLYPGK
ncbi:hypothetical protein L1S35_01070 [Flavobacterium sp. AS60]|uniref:hypothetical protein n=1 Tax=Flavobacterium anseongense TaxID=2910677 RepID=UPI001F2D62FD|nr:hypothetical protein [Flavobacterium sp. AS60]MCF6128246.1 hypothetical protein [Flavobacterium sp. AS60]